MSILIKGMEMPKNCEECAIKSWDTEDYVCPFSGVSTLCISRQDDCPLIPVPEHGRLIDADALFAKIEKSAVMAKQEYNFDSWYACCVSANFVLGAPTIVPQDEQFGNSEQLRGDGGRMNVH